MRKLVVSTFMTLDGVMQAPGGPPEDPSGGFSYGGWSVNYWDDQMNQSMAESMASKPDFVLGRKTYDIFAAYWPNTTEPGAEDLNNARKYVASRTLNKVDWQNSTLIKGDVAKEVARLKEADGPELQVLGSSNLLQTLFKHNLIDELFLMIFPVAVGNGKRLFGEGTNPSGFKLLKSTITGTGVIVATYAYGGELKTGSFA